MMRRCRRQLFGMNREWGPHGYLDPNLQDPSKEVRRLYRHMYKMVEFVQIAYRLDMPPDQMRKVIRKEFDRFKGITDPRVQRTRIIYTSQLLKSALNQWMGKNNMSRYFDNLQDNHTPRDLERIRNPQNIDDEYFRDLVQDPTYSHKNMRIPLVQKMVMPRRTFYVEEEMTKLRSYASAEDAKERTRDDNIVADELYLDTKADDLHRDVSIAQHLALSEHFGEKAYPAVRKVQCAEPDNVAVEGRANPQRFLRGFKQFCESAGFNLDFLREDVVRGDELRRQFGRIVGSALYHDIYTSQAFTDTLNDAKRNLAAQDINALLKSEKSGNASVLGAQLWQERSVLLQELQAAGRLASQKNFTRDMGASRTSDKVGHFPALNAVYELEAKFKADLVYYMKLHVLQSLLDAWKGDKLQREAPDATRDAQGLKSWLQGGKWKNVVVSADIPLSLERYTTA